MNKKYELFEENYINHDERILYRIRALITFVDINENIINAGELGGYIENESNLSQEDKSWVYGNSKVYSSTITNSTIRNSIIRNSFVLESTVGDLNIYNSIIENSIIENSNTKNSNIEFANIENSSITKANIKNNVTIKNKSVTGEITMPFKDIFQYQCRHRMLTAILTEDDRILYTLGCQHNIDEEEFIDRIHNEDGGLKENPHRAEYLRLIKIIKIYFEEVIKSGQKI